MASPRELFILFKKYIVVPVTSLLSILLTAYISHTFLFVYIPLIYPEWPKFASIIFVLFVPFPICIYWSVFLILTGDPGRITK